MDTNMDTKVSFEVLERVMEGVNSLKSLVPEARLELAQAEARGILSPLRLPVPPLRHAHILSFPVLSWQVLLQTGRRIPLISTQNHLVFSLFPTPIQGKPKMVIISLDDSTVQNPTHKIHQSKIFP
jgi:hypothetical protein